VAGIFSPSRILSSALSKRFFLDAFQVSDRHYWQREASKASWKDLRGFIEYDMRVISAPMPNGKSKLLVAVRAVRGRRFKRVKLSIAAKHQGVIYRDTLEIHNLTEEPRLVGLPDICPKLDRKGRDHALPVSGSLFIKLAEAVNSYDVSVDGFKKTAEIFRPVVVKAQRGEFVYRWGRYWNTALIEKEKQNIKSRSYFRVVKSAGQLWRPLRLRRVLHELLTIRPLLSLAFWNENLGTANHLRNSLEGPKEFVSLAMKLARTEAA